MRSRSRDSIIDERCFDDRCGLDLTSRWAQPSPMPKVEHYAVRQAPHYPPPVEGRSQRRRSPGRGPGGHLHPPPPDDANTTLCALSPLTPNEPRHRQAPSNPYAAASPPEAAGMRGWDPAPPAWHSPPNTVHPPSRSHAHANHPNNKENAQPMAYRPLSGSARKPLERSSGGCGPTRGERNTSSAAAARPPPTAQRQHTPHYDGEVGYEQASPSPASAHWAHYDKLGGASFAAAAHDPAATAQALRQMHRLLLQHQELIEQQASAIRAGQRERQRLAARVEALEAAVMGSRR